MGAEENPSGGRADPAVAVVLALSGCHLLNDLIQSLIAATYPVLKDRYALSFGQIGLITLAFQLTASVLQPLVGFLADRRPRPFSLAAGMGVTLVGLVLLSRADSFPAILTAAALVGFGSAVFHPEASRVARLASAGRHGTAQSVFQVGGNAGSALGPLLAAFVVVPRGQGSLVWFSGFAVGAIALLLFVGDWYARHLRELAARPKRVATRSGPPLSRARVAAALAVLVGLVFSKGFYLASLTNFYTFYLIGRFGVSVETAEVLLFVFLAAVAAGTILGGPVGDRIGFKSVIWVSVLGVLPFTLALPYTGLVGTAVLSVVIGLVLASAFPAIVVYAQELVPTRVGLVAGLFFGLAFGMGAIGAALLGELADRTSVAFVYRVCAFLPALGGLAILLPTIPRTEGASA